MGDGRILMIAAYLFLFANLAKLPESGGGGMTKPDIWKNAMIRIEERSQLHPSGCIQSLYSKNDLGYARMKIEGKNHYVHRVVMMCYLKRFLELHEVVQHACDNPWFDEFLQPQCKHGCGPKIGVYGDHARDESVRRRVKAGRTIAVVGQGAAMGGQRTITVTGSTAQRNVKRNVERETFSAEYARIAMGIGWMTREELSQAIPPPYTEFIGRELLIHLEASK